MHTPTLRVLAVAATVVAVFSASSNVGHAAQSVLERARRAAEEAAKRAKETPAQPQPAEPAQRSQPSPPSQRSQPIGADDLVTPDQGASVVDPKLMPDILGIHLGATPHEALVAAQQNYKAQAMPNQLPMVGIPQPLDLGFQINLGATGAAGNDQLVVELTPPPNPQVVWRVARMTNRIHTNRSTLLSALRQKYGKEAIAFVFNGANEDSGITTDDGQISTLVWLMNERGQRVPAPRPSSILRQCAYPSPNAIGYSREYLEGQGGTFDPFSTWSKTTCVGIVASIQPDLRGDPQIIEQMMIAVFDAPLEVRAQNATVTWWKAAIERARQQEREKTKQNAPKL